MFDPVGQRSLSAPAIAAVTVLAVVDITAPTELNSRVGGTNGALCVVTQNVAGINEWTLYAFDATSSGSVNSPYVLAASGSGQWIAMGGKYSNGGFTDAIGITAGVDALAAPLQVNGAATQTRNLAFRTAGVDRWIVRANGTAESGANAGSDYVIVSRADDGSFLMNVLTITRSTGDVALGSTLSVTGLATLTAGFTALATSIISGSGVQLGVTSTTASSANAGGSVRMISDDGAALASGDRLGLLAFGGAKDGASTINTAVRIAALATEAWSGTACGAKMEFRTTPNTTASPVVQMVLDQDGSLDLSAHAIKNFVAEVVVFTGTSLSISASHRGRVLSTTSTGAVTVTLPASLGAGFPLTVVQKGAGQITFAAGSGTTLNNRQSQTKAAGQYAICTIVSDVADSWILAGDTGT